MLRTQSLLNAVSREAAMDWLQEAIAVAERSPVASNGGTAGNVLLLPLVREQARMLLVERRYSALWEMLSRLESQQGTAPELWTIRANAAQCLGLHQDSVHAYMMPGMQHAAHGGDGDALTDHVFPRLPVSHWEPYVPNRLRCLMQRDGAVL